MSSLKYLKDATNLPFNRSGFIFLFSVALLAVDSQKPIKPHPIHNIHFGAKDVEIYNVAKTASFINTVRLKRGLITPSLF